MNNSIKKDDLPINNMEIQLVMEKNRTTGTNRSKSQ